MFSMDNLLTLCDAALLVEERDAKSRKQESNTRETRSKQSKEPDVSIDTKRLFSSQTFKRSKGKFSSKYEGNFYENTSDELNKKFVYTCKYSPTKCSFVVKSYGSETRGLTQIQKHIMEHFMKESYEDVPPKKDSLISFPFTMDLDPDVMERICGKTLQEPAEEVRSEKDILHFDHDYAKIGDDSPMEVEWKKRKRTKVNTTLDKLGQQYLDGWLRSMPYVAHVPTGPFPFVHHPDSLEPAAVVEFYSNGEPVDVIQPALVPTYFEKKVESLANKRKPKVFQAVDEVRSVLECVENRVACKHSAWCAEQKDAPVTQNGIENSENMEEIAWRNILMLTKQRKKRRCRDKPSAYICEICNKHFTANTSLTYHYMGHLKLKPFMCKVCSRTFTRRHSLKYHMMIHNGKNRFDCPMCDRQFRHPSHYKEHLRKHTGEEPYSCKFCSNKFKTRNSFKRHLRMQHQKLLTSNGIVPMIEDN